MTIATTHFFSGVADKFVDQPLVNAVRGQIADERVPKTVPATDDAPTAILQNLVEIVVSLIAAQRPKRQISFPAIGRPNPKGLGATGMILKPLI